MKYAIVDSKVDDDVFKFAAIIEDDPKYEKTIFSFADVNFSDDGVFGANVLVFDQVDMEFVQDTSAESMVVAEALLQQIVDDITVATISNADKK